jgi:S1-C subfamily serine protease
MGVSTAYVNVKRSIVAFVQNYIPIQRPDDPPPMYPPIIGTGFVVNAEGIIATNAHVAKAFSRVFRPPEAPKTEWPVRAILFHMCPEGMLEVPLEILGVAQISKFGHPQFYYGPKEGPDIAFVHVGVRGLPQVTLDAETPLIEGMDVATAGFPMGTDALTAPGWLHQLTPTLQRGIISAVLPFTSPKPHAFSVDIMTQGGASGSPVFLCETGAVIGVLYAGLHDIDLTLAKKDPYRLPTNISYVVPAHYISWSLAEAMKVPGMQLKQDSPTLEDMLAVCERRNVFTDGKTWVRKASNADIERERIQAFSKMEAPMEK